MANNLSDRFFSVVKEKHDIAHNLPFMQRFKTDEINTLFYQILQLQQLLVITQTLEEKMNLSDDPVFLPFKENPNLLKRSIAIQNDIDFLLKALKTNLNYNNFTGITLNKTTEYVAYLQSLESIEIIAHFYTITQASMFGGGLFRNTVLNALGDKSHLTRDGVTYYFTQHKVPASDESQSEEKIVRLNSLHIIKMLNVIAPESDKNGRLTNQEEEQLNNEGNVSFDWFIDIFSDLEKWCIENSAQLQPTTYQPKARPTLPPITPLLTKKTNCLFWSAITTTAIAATAIAAYASMAP